MKGNFKFIAAKPVWINSEKYNQYADFVADFDYDGTSELSLFISAKTDYCAKINGVFIGNGQYGDFPELKCVDEIPVTAFLKKGKNRLAVTAWCLNANTFSRIADGFGVVFEITDGKHTVVYSDENTLSRESREYKCGYIYSITPQIGAGYDYTFGDDWCAENAPLYGFGKSVVKEFGGEYFTRPVEKLVLSPAVNGITVQRGSFILGKTDDLSVNLQNAYLSRSDETGKVFTAEDGADGVYFIADMKEESTGYLYFDLETEDVADIYVTFGEHLHDLRVRNKIGDRNFMLLHRNVQGRVKFTAYMRRIGCRYLQFFIRAKKATVYGAGLLPAYYPVVQKPLASKNPLTERILKTAAHTLKACMHEHYEDCPWREQAQYGMDSLLQILSGYYAFDNPEFPAAALRLFGHELNENGLLCITTPCRDELFIPSFSAAFVIAVAAYTEFYGDLSVFTDVKNSVETILDKFLSQIDGTGVIKRGAGWNFYEWTDGLDFNEKETYHAPLSFLVVKALNCAAPLFEKSGDLKTAKKYGKAAGALKSAANEFFFDEKRGLYATYVTDGKKKHYAEYTQAVAVYCGAAQGERAEKICNVLCSDNELIKLSLSNYLFKYCAVLDTLPQMKDYVYRDIQTRWGKMLCDGATSFWETEEGEKAFDNAGSLCHGWSAIPLYIIKRYGLDG